MTAALPEDRSHVQLQVTGSFRRYLLQSQGTTSVDKLGGQSALKNIYNLEFKHRDGQVF